jgi:hypothetical protein
MDVTYKARLPWIANITNDAGPDSRFFWSPKVIKITGNRAKELFPVMGSLLSVLKF